MSDYYVFLTTLFVGLFLFAAFAMLLMIASHTTIAAYAVEKAEFEICVSNGGAWITGSRNLCLRSHVDLP